MPQGTRERIGRAAVVGLGVVLCSGLVGCLGDTGPKKNSLPPAKVDKSQWKTTVSPPPPGQVGATQPNRPVGTAQPGATVGMQPGATPYGGAPTGSTAIMGTPVRQNNAATMSPYPAGGNTPVPSVTPYPSGVQPAGGTTPISQYPGNSLTPARVSPEPNALNAGFRTTDPRTQALLDTPLPPSAPSVFPPSVGPSSPVTTPTAPMPATFPNAPQGPIAPLQQ